MAQLKKFAEGSGLGISLEGTVDVEDGQEVRPHHYIRSILPEGPVGQNGCLRSGDELLEVRRKKFDKKFFTKRRNKRKEKKRKENFLSFAGERLPFAWYKPHGSCQRPQRTSSSCAYGLWPKHRIPRSALSDRHGAASGCFPNSG